MTGCPDCERMARQIAAMESKLRLQAQEWERITGELDGYRQAEARRAAAYSEQGRKRVAARWAKREKS